MAFHAGMLQFTARAMSGAAVGAAALYGTMAHAESPRPAAVSVAPGAGTGVAACLGIIERRLSTIERALGLVANDSALVTKVLHTNERSAGVSHASLPAARFAQHTRMPSCGAVPPSPLLPPALPLAVGLG